MSGPNANSHVSPDSNGNAVMPNRKYRFQNEHQSLVTVASSHTPRICVLVPLLLILSHPSAHPVSHTHPTHTRIPSTESWSPRRTKSVEASWTRSCNYGARPEGVCSVGNSGRQLGWWRCSIVKLCRRWTLNVCTVTSNRASGVTASLVLIVCNRHM